LVSTAETKAVASSVGNLVFNWEASPNKDSFAVSYTSGSVNSILLDKEASVLQ